MSNSPYISVSDATAILWQAVDEKFLVYASDSLDAVLWRFDDNRLWYHNEEVVIDLKSWIKVYRPKITPVVSITSQKLVDETWAEIWDYPFKIWCYNDYIRLQNPIRFKNKYQFLKLNVSCWYFEQNEVPALIKQFIAKIGAKLQEEAIEAWRVVNWQSSITEWWKTSLRLWDYQVWFAQWWVLSSQITAWLSNLAIQIWGTWELDMIYSKYWKPFIWMI